MDKPTALIFACSGCHKKFYLSGFKVSRLGLRNKTCLECATRRRRPSAPTALVKPSVTLSEEDLTILLGI